MNSSFAAISILFEEGLTVDIEAKSTALLGPVIGAFTSVTVESGFLLLVKINLVGQNCGLPTSHRPVPRHPGLTFRDSNEWYYGEV